MSTIDHSTGKPAEDMIPIRELPPAIQRGIRIANKASDNPGTVNEKLAELERDLTIMCGVQVIVDLPDIYPRWKKVDA